MRFSVDSLITRDNRVFAYGWAMHPSARVTRIGFELHLVDGAMARLPATHAKERPDVAQAFPAEPNARYSGWMVYGAWAGAAVKSIALTGELEGGELFSFDLGDPARTLARSEASPVKRFLTRVRSWGKRPDPTTTEEERTTTGRFSALQAALSDARQDRCALVLDHSMGGGASHYSKSWVAQRLQARPLVLVLSFDIRGLRYTLDLVSSQGVMKQFVFLVEPATGLAASGLVDEVLYNDAVSFPRPDEVPGWLVALRSVPGASLTMVVHDYLMVCPSQFLLNDHGRFCGVPEVSECMRCLVGNTNEFAELFPSNDMPHWRRSWAAALSRADKIVCFSSSSRVLLGRGYPQLDMARVSIEPHDVPPFATNPLLDPLAPLHVGVVGSIGWHKGAGVIRDLAAEIKHRKMPVKITVIGLLDADADPSVVTTTGGFDRAELPSVITRTGANIFLLPSICPETFSYVAHELMGMQVPVVCFDFGAPADSVGSYRLGRVVPRTNAADLLDKLLQFHSELASEHLVSQ
jgi:hypothetical protein